MRIGPRDVCLMRDIPVHEDLIPDPSKRLILRRKDMALAPRLAWAEARLKEPSFLHVDISIVFFVQYDQDSYKFIIGEYEQPVLSSSSSVHHHGR